MKVGLFYDWWFQKNWCFAPTFALHNKILAPLFDPAKWSLSNPVPASIISKSGLGVDVKFSNVCLFLKFIFGENTEMVWLKSFRLAQSILLNSLYLLLMSLLLVYWTNRQVRKNAEVFKVWAPKKKKKNCHHIKYIVALNQHMHDFLYFLYTIELYCWTHV